MDVHTIVKMIEMISALFVALFIFQFFRGACVGHRGEIVCLVCNYDGEKTNNQQDHTTDSLMEFGSQTVSDI